MRVLVTGAAGFLGQHICDALNDTGHSVIGFDNSWREDRRLTYASVLEGDITDLQEWTVSKEIDAVIHLAAIASPKTCDTDPATAFNVNVNGTHQVLKMALEAGAKKFVFVSSAHVYGVSPKYLPTDEQAPFWLQDTYTTTKILGEQLCELYHKSHGLSYTTLRLFNVYGPGQLPGYFVPDMVSKAKSGGIGQLAGETTKDFVYVDDVARAFVKALETPFVGPINIGTGVQTSLGRIAAFITNKLQVEDAEAITGKITHMQANFSRAHDILGWEPSVGIEEGLDAVIAEAVPVH